jgi:hypothetical protein
VDDGEDEEDSREDAEGEGSRRARRDALSLSIDEMVPSETSAEVSESRLRDEVSSPVADNGDEGGDEEEAGSFRKGSEKEKVVVVEVVLGSAMKLLRFLAGQLDGCVEAVVVVVAVD